MRLPPPRRGVLFYSAGDDPGRVRRRLFFAGLALSLLIGGGVLGYWLLGAGRWSFIECAYMVIITVTTVGYREVLPVSQTEHGQLFTMLLLLSGAGVSVYFLSSLTAFIVEGDLREVLWRRKMDKSLNALSHHYIVCGCGETGRSVVEELLHEGKDVVVIERQTENLEKLTRRLGDRFMGMVGDATEDEILIECGIRRASGVVATLHDDSANLFVSVSARQLNPTVRIVSRVVDEKAGPKLTRAGADAVISPNALGGRRMAHELVRPSVVGFMDLVVNKTDQTLSVEEYRVATPSPLDGLSLAESRIRDVANVLVLAVKAADGRDYTFPPPTFVLQSGMTLIILGEPSAVGQLRAHFDGP